MNSQVVFALLAAGAGVCIAVQAAANGAFRSHLGSPVWAAFFSICGTILCATLAMLILRPPAPSWETLRATSWWFWVGGPTGALIVLAGALITPRIGAATFLAFLIGGQMLCSASLDHFGAMGLSARPVSSLRLAGILLVIGGAVMVWLSQPSSQALPLVPPETAS